MYVPSSFSISDRGWILDAIARDPFGLLITCPGEFPYVTHLPMLALERDGQLWVTGHVARANPHAAAILEGQRATAVFRGPHAYVSASWYEEPYETVPTWNYVAVQASGRLQECDPLPLLAALTRAFETAPEPWQLERLDVEYVRGQLRAIVAFEMRAERVDAKAKLSQNRSEEDRRRVARRLAQSARPLDRDCAAAMEAEESRVRTTKRGP
jgi:transcriptional regulator